MTLDAEDVDAIARRVVQLLDERHEPSTVGRLVDAATLAAALGVSKDYVYANKASLGGRPLGPTGPGRKPRWRFPLDPHAAAARADVPDAAEGALQPTARASRIKPSSAVDLLPIRPARGVPE